MSDISPPQPLPEQLLGDRWQFASVPAGELEWFFRDRPIPVLNVPDEHLPVGLGLASIVPIPGIVIEGGRRSMQLAQWLETQQPLGLDYVDASLGSDVGGVVLSTGLHDRWVVATFEDAEVKQAAQIYQQRQQESQGLHFLLLQPDDSGMTYTGFWLLKH